MEEPRETREKPGRRGGLVGPVILIGLGVVFLLNNLGMLPWSVWGVILRLWPVLLVAAGLDLLLGRRSVWGSLLALVLTLALLAGIVWLFWTGILPRQPTTTEKVNQALDGATRAEVVIAPAVGTLHLEPLAASDDLVSGTIHPLRGEQVKREFTMQDGTAKFALRSEGAFGPFIPFAGGWGGRWEWDLGLNPGVPLALEVSMGTGQSELDLSGLQVSGLDVNMGLGQTTVVLPDEGRFQVKIDAAVGQTIVVIPAGLEARIRVSTGIAGRQLPAGYRQQDDVYISPGYAAAEDRVDLEVSQAIGNISIQHAGAR